MEKYDPYNPNDLDEIFKEMEKNKKINMKKENVKENQKEEIGWNILKKMGWKGKGITI